MGFGFPLIFLLISAFGVLYCLLYTFIKGESREEIGDTEWLRKKCRR